MRSEVPGQVLPSGVPFPSPRLLTPSKLALGSVDPWGGLALILNSSQFVTEACRFVAIFLSLYMELSSADASHGIEEFGDAVVFAFALMFELAGEILLL